MDTYEKFIDANAYGHKRSTKVMANLGLSLPLLEIYKKAAHKKYGRRFGYRWLSRLDKQLAILNALLVKGNSGTD